MDSALARTPNRSALRSNLWGQLENRARMCLTLGFLDRVRESARAMTELVPLGKEERFRAASILAQCASRSANDPELAPERREEEFEAYAREAVFHLNEAVRLGYRDAERIDATEAFAGLRGREDFEELLMQLGRPVAPH
jgi:hypothetical protein